MAMSSGLVVVTYRRTRLYGAAAAVRAKTLAFMVVSLMRYRVTVYMLIFFSCPRSCEAPVHRRCVK